MTILKFEDILAWEKAHELTLMVYALTKDFPREEIFGLTSQIRRAAVSVPSNIAEGFKRRTKSDSIHFYNIAQGSLEEAKYQLLLARDLGYIRNSDFDLSAVITDEAGRLLSGWIRNAK